MSADRFPKRHHAYPYIFNSYAYVVNNPTNYLDPSGHMFLQLQAASEEVDRLTTVVDVAWNRIQLAQAGFRRIIEGLPEVINTIQAGGTAADNAVTIANDLLGQGLSEAELVGAGGEDAGILGLRLASAGRLLERVSGVSDQLEQQVEEMRRISETLIETLVENDEFVALQSQEVLEEMAAVRATSLTADAAEIAADATEAAAVAAEGLEDFDAMAALILLAL